jgi:hypothetical protein
VEVRTSVARSVITISLRLLLGIVCINVLLGRISFGLLTARRTYYLQADTEADFKSWMAALKLAINEVKDKTEEVLDGKPVVSVVVVLYVVVVSLIPTH